MAAAPRTTVWLGALALAAFQVVGSLGAADGQPDRKGIDAIAVALLLLGPAALAVRDRWPLAAAAVALAATDVFVGLGYPYGPVFASVIVALHTGVQAGRRAGTWALAAAGYAGFVVAHVLDSRTDDPNAVHLALVAGWLLAVLTISDVVRTRREQAAQRAEAEEDQARRRAQDQRLGLAQELHDVLAHNISLINVQASVALHLFDERPDDARPALVNIKDASRDALQELRTALDVLRRGEAAPRSPAPRLADLDELVASMRAGGFDIRLDTDPDLPSLPAAVELAAYRIVQEALTNVARHSGARHAAVSVRHEGDGDVTVEVVDDGTGPGLATGATPGNGIAGMRERAAALHGSVEAGPAPSGGFRVLARIPAQP